MENTLFGSVKLKGVNESIRDVIDTLHRAKANTCVNMYTKTIDFTMPYDKTAIAELRESLKAGGYTISFDNLQEFEN